MLEVILEMLKLPLKSKIISKEKINTHISDHSAIVVDIETKLTKNNDSIRFASENTWSKCVDKAESVLKNL